MSVISNMMDFLAKSSPSEIRDYVTSAEKFIADVKHAIQHKGASIDADLTVGIDIAQALSGMPIVGTDAKAIAIGLEVVKFAVDHGDIKAHNSGEGGIGAAPEGNGNVTF